MEELFSLLAQSYSKELVEQIKEGYSAERPVSLRANTLKATADEVLFAFSDMDISRVAWYESAFVLKNATEIEIANTPLFQEGKIYLQSLSSMLPPLYLNPQPGESILDMTAAPGGKTTQLATLSEGKVLITACERDKIRFERLKFNLERQGATRVSAMCCDASTLNDFLSFDKILLDAPCTGTGTVTPSNAIRFSKEYLKKCVQAQEKLLRKALRLLKKDGTLVYSTCSVLKEENELLLARILPEMHARILPIAPFEGVPTLPSREGTVAVLPNALYEGFFVAKITK